jgi:L-threonylcarbamoyladenylate synthase
VSVTVGVDAAGVAAAARAVRAGGVILYPTETVYGIGGDARRPDVVNRVRGMKGRDGSKPVLVLVDTWARVAGWIAGDDSGAAAIMQHDPPLAVTLLVEATPDTPVDVVGPDGLVGVRRTSDPFCQALIAEADAPLLSTSANPPGEPAPWRFDDVAATLRASVDVAVDGGRDLPGVPSTVARVADGRVNVVRLGAVSAETLERVLAGPR